LGWAWVGQEFVVSSEEVGWMVVATVVDVELEDVFGGDIVGFTEASSQRMGSLTNPVYQGSIWV
jgi:hypothetical protein